MGYMNTGISMKVIATNGRLTNYHETLQNLPHYRPIMDAISKDG